MNISCLRKTNLRVFTGIAVVLLLAISASTYADDHKDKKTTSAPAKPAAPQKAPAKSPSTGSSGGTHSSGDGAKTRSSGNTTTGNNPGSRNSGNTTSNGAGARSSGNTSAGNPGSGNYGNKTGNGTSGSHSSGNGTGSHNSGNAAGANTTNNTGGGRAPIDPSYKRAPGNSPTGTSVKDSGRATHKTDNSSPTHTVNNSKDTNTTNNPNSIHPSNNSAGTRGTDREKAGSAGKGSTLGTRETAKVVRTRNGSEAVFHPNGHIREVHTHGMTIIHTTRGSRTVVVERPNHSRIVVDRFGHGYVQRPFVYRNREFFSRTYYYHGHPYARYYRGYPYRGLVLHGYVPHSYYSPAFYGWAYHPWRSSVHYAWGWSGSPWYRHYNYYFTPYAAYPSASFWLTDYLLATSLQMAYQSQLASQNNSFASEDANGPSILSSEIKQEIADEVQRQLALENAERQSGIQGDLDINSSGLPRMLAEVSPGNPRIFIVASSLDVADNQGQGCALTEGDVLRLVTPPPSDATAASLQVLASKNQDCMKGKMVTVEFTDLQEMQNQMRASIDQGLQDLQAHQGGLPAPPPAAAAPPVQSAFAPIAPPADSNVVSELQQQAQEADKAEQEVLNEARQSDSSIAADAYNSSQAPLQIALGQTIKEVEAALGKPQRIANLGAKQIYVYQNMKITFLNGKVSDVE